MDRPWRQRYPGYSVSWHKQVWLRIAPKRLRAHQTKLRQLLKRSRGQSLPTTIRKLNPMLRGWANRGLGKVRRTDEGLGGTAVRLI